MTNQVSNETNISAANNLAIDLLNTYKNKYGFFISTHTHAHVVGEWVYDELVHRFVDSDHGEERLVDDYSYEYDMYFCVDDWNFALEALQNNLKYLEGDFNNKDKIEDVMNKWRRKLLDYSYDRTLQFLLAHVEKCFSDHDCDITCDDSIMNFFGWMPKYLARGIQKEMLHSDIH